MNEPTPNDTLSQDEEPPYLDYERPLSPNWCLNPEERAIVLKCISILTDEYYVDSRSFRSLTATRDKSIFTATARKIEDNIDLNKRDIANMSSAVAHVAMFPITDGNEVMRQLGLKDYQLYWFSSHIDQIADDEAFNEI